MKPYVSGNLICMITAALLCLASSWTSALAAELIKSPILRVEAGMHTADVTTISANFDQTRIVTGSLDKRVFVWRGKDGSLERTLRIPIHTGEVDKILAVAISPDSRAIAVGTELNGDDAPVYLFDADSGKMIRRFTGHENPVSDICFSPDGKYLVVALTGAAGIRVWSMVDYKLVAKDRYYGRRTYRCQFSKDGLLATTSEDRYVRLYDKNFNIAAQEHFPGDPASLPGDRGPFGITWSPTGTELAVATGKTVEILSGTNLARLHKVDLKLDPTELIHWVAWVESSGDSRIWASVRGKGQASLASWNQHGRGVIRRTFNIATGGIFAISPLRNGQIAIATGDPSWLVVGDDGAIVRLVKGNSSDFRFIENQFLTSKSGSTVLVHNGNKLVAFDIVKRTYVDPKGLAVSSLVAASSSRSGLDISGIPSYNPLVNGKKLFREIGDSAVYSSAIAPDGTSFVLGTGLDIQYFDSSRNKIRSVDTPARVTSINYSGDGRFVVATLLDGTIRWYDNRGHEVVGLYLAKDLRRWMLWTPEGYYDAPPGSEDLISWHINNTEVSEGSVVPNSRLFDAFFRPDIVQAKFAGDDVSKFIRITAADALRNPPPTITITKSPSYNSGLPREEICFRVHDEGGGIGEVRLFHNGKLTWSTGFYRDKTIDDEFDIRSINGEALKRNLTAVSMLPKENDHSAPPIGNGSNTCATVESIPGENEIAIATFNRDNTIQSGFFEKSYHSSVQKRKPNIFVLSIGIDQYKAPGIDLVFAGKDARDFVMNMTNRLRSQFGQDAVRSHVLATSVVHKEDIAKAIQRVREAIGPQDIFVLFVASHGLLWNNQYYLVTSDFNGRNGATSLISSSEIIEYSKHVPALTQLYVLDSCHAGGLDNIAQGLYESRFALLGRRMGLHVFASAGAYQEALDGYKGNGLFTHSLLANLRDRRLADQDGDGTVTISELGLSARQMTKAISSRLGHSQVPKILNFGVDRKLY